MTPTTTATTAAASVMSAGEALTLADPFTSFGFAPDRYAEICFYRCRDCGARGPVGRALLDGDFRHLPPAEQAAHLAHRPLRHCGPRVLRPHHALPRPRPVAIRVYVSPITSRAALLGERRRNVRGAPFREPRFASMEAPAGGTEPQVVKTLTGQNIDRTVEV
ncbi:hypothetical protein GCM10010315_41170 [Streptomyces luteosporeus]|uniref:Uncharacterized protein n=1 Tax=Streptomyces luteosporeus TaxID=173856 RepID=A0ABN3TXC3_9ACTN